MNHPTIAAIYVHDLASLNKKLQKKRRSHWASVTSPLSGPQRPYNEDRNRNSLVCAENPTDSNMRPKSKKEIRNVLSGRPHSADVQTHDTTSTVWLRFFKRY
jgi:hypothetical protein